MATDKQWKRYITQASQFNPVTRKKIHGSYTVLLAIENQHHPFRAAMSDALFSDESSRLFPLGEGEAQVEIRALATNTNTNRLKVLGGDSLSPGWTQYLDHDESGRPFELQPGRYELIAVARYDWPDPAPSSDSSRMLTDSLNIKTSFEVFSENKQLIKPIHDPQSAALAETNLLAGIKLSRRKAWIDRNSWDKRFHLDYVIPGTGVPYWCSFDVEVWVKGKRLKHISSVVLEPNTPSNHFHLLMAQLSDFMQSENRTDSAPQIDQFTLRLVPNPEHLKTELDGYEYLDHVIEIKDIPIEPYQPE